VLAQPHLCFQAKCDPERKVMSRRLAIVAVLSVVRRALAAPEPPIVDGTKRADAFRAMASEMGWTEKSSVSSGEVVKLTFMLRQQNKNELAKVVERVSDPDSPNYGHYLTKNQVDKLTAPLPHDVAAVEAALRGHEFHSEADGAFITSIVPVSFAERLLGGNFVRFCRQGGDDCQLRNPSAAPPAALREACDLITPLDDPLPPRFPGPIIKPLSPKFSPVVMKTGSTLRGTASMGAARPTPTVFD